MIKLIIFDLDGTLFETGPAIHETLLTIMERRGLNEIPYDRVRRAIGLGLEHLMSTFSKDELAALGNFTELKAEFNEIYSKIYIDQSPAFDGLLDFLEFWQGHLAIASNKLEYYVQGVVENSVINKFNWVAATGGDSFKVKKPDPKQLFYACEKAQVKPSEALMVGDGLPDIEAAKAAGMRSVAVSFGYEDCDVLLGKGADACISHYNQLPHIINDLNGA